MSKGREHRTVCISKITNTSQKMDFSIAIYLRSISRIKIYRKFI